MDSIRNFTFRIRSSIACDEYQCPAIRDRLEHHFQSHHSADQQYCTSGQCIASNKPSPRNADVPIINPGDLTSTSDVDSGLFIQTKVTKTSYREALETVVSIWANDLPKYLSPSTENLKRNIVNELIEKIDRLKLEIDEDIYDAKLSREVSKFLESLPPTPDLKKRACALRDNFINTIHELNRNKMNKNNNNSDRGKIKRKEPTISNQGSKLMQAKKTRNYKRKATAMKTTQSSSAEQTNKPYNGPKFRHKNPNSDDNSVDAQVQHSLTDMSPYYGKIYAQPKPKTDEQHKTKQQNMEINEIVLKEKISSWMTRVFNKSERNFQLNDKNVLTGVLFNRLRPLLTKQINSQNYKTILKKEISNFLNDYFDVEFKNNSSYFNKLIESLIITILIEKTNREVSQLRRNSGYLYYYVGQTLEYNTKTECFLKTTFYNIVKDAFENVIVVPKSVENDITELLFHNIDSIRNGYHEDLKENLYIILKSSTKLGNYAIANVINVIMDQMLCVLCDEAVDYNSVQKVHEPPWACVLSVYQSELELCNRSRCSVMIPKQTSKLIKKSLNVKEKAHKKLIYALVASWVKTLPKKFNEPEDMIIKETIINNLSIDIFDQVKLEAVAPEKISEREKYFSFFIYRWLNRFEYFDDIKNIKPYADKLTNKLMDIPMPAHYSQQMRMNNEFMIMTAFSQASLTNEVENDILETINSQPSEIFINADKETRNQQIHEFALLVKNNLENDKLNDSIVQWLRIMIKPEECSYFSLLKEQLSDRIPQGTKDVKNEIKTSSLCCKLNTNNTDGPENQFKEFIVKYMEHNNDAESSIARETFGNIMKLELKKLNTLDTEEDDNNPDDEMYVITAPQKLLMELKYINVISDWLKILPLPTSFNEIGNRIRIEFLIGLAKNIDDVEESIFLHLTGIERNVYLASMINKYVDQLPISRTYKKIMFAMVDDLVRKILEVRHRSCCENANCNIDISSITNISDEQLINFIEEYIRKNYEELNDDEFKLEAFSARLFKEIVKMRNGSAAMATNPASLNNEHEPRLSNDEPVRRLSVELCYAKEISDCLNNLPLLSSTDKVLRDLRVKMISSLAERMFERWQGKNEEPDNIYHDNDLLDYMTLWILELPLNTTKEIDESIVKQQLLNRMERVNKQQLDKQAMPHLHNTSSENCKLPYACCTVSSKSRQEPGAAIIDAIENWCAELPIETENENTNTTIKSNVATALIKRVCELNMNPKCFSDNNLYRELFSEEIDDQLEILPQNFELETVKQNLKRQLLSSIMEKRNKMREQASSTEYKQELERTIELSLPNPVKTYQEESPGFKIYKDRLATMFILENFDHGFDNVKDNYQKIIKKEIDNYFQDAQRRNAIPLTKDQIYYELYSALYNVPLPNKTSIAEEVEEIKTRCEIDNWFETLPLQAPACPGEVLAKNQILAMLAKRIHKSEKYGQTPDGDIYKEIIKWLSKFSFLPGHENTVSEFAHKLLQILKSTSAQRKCIKREEATHIGKLVKSKKRTNNKGILGTSQIAGPSGEYKIRPSPTHHHTSSPSSTKPADLILNIVETWCHELPLPSNAPQGSDNMEIIKDYLVTKIIKKISELNVNNETLNNGFLYDALLDDELENLFSTLPTSYEFNQSKEQKKNELKNAIKSVKPLIQKEKAKYEYKQELQNIVDVFLIEPQNTTPKIKALYISLKDNIIDNFIIYNYHRNDEDGSPYKMIVNVAVDKYFTEVNDNKDALYDPLMIGNHLLCEMAKVPVPSETATLEEIEEIRIKFEITDFFNDLSLCNCNDKLPMRNQIIFILTKRVSELAKKCFAPDKMRNEILKCFKKLNENVDLEKVDALVERIIHLLATEAPNKSESGYANPFPLPYEDQRYNQSYQTPTQQANNPRYDRENQNVDDGQWTSLLSATSTAQGPGSGESDFTKREINHLEDMPRSQFNRQGEDKLNESKLNYSGFKRGVALNSSIREDQGPDGLMLAPNTMSNTPNYQTKSIILSDSNHLKLAPYVLSNQDSEFVQNISLQQSSSLNKSNKAANNQLNISPSNTISGPQSQDYRPNQLEQWKTLSNYENQKPSELLSSMPANRTTQFHNSLPNQTIQKEHSNQNMTHQQAQQAPQQVASPNRQKFPKLVAPQTPIHISPQTPHYVSLQTPHNIEHVSPQNQQQVSQQVSPQVSSPIRQQSPQHTPQKISRQVSSLNQQQTQQELPQEVLTGVAPPYLQQIPHLVSPQTPHHVPASVLQQVNLPISQDDQRESSEKSDSRFVNPLNLPYDDQRNNQSCQSPAEQQRFSRYDRDVQNTDDGQWTSLLSETPKSLGPGSDEANITRREIKHLEDTQITQVNNQGKDDMDESKLNYSAFKREVTLSPSLSEEQKLHVSQQVSQPVSQQDSPQMLQQVPQQHRYGPHKIPKGKIDISHSTPSDKRSTNNQEKTQFPALQPSNEETGKTTNQPSIQPRQMSKTSIRFQKVPSSTNVQITPPKRPVSESNVSCGKRRPSISFLNPPGVRVSERSPGVIPESITSGQTPQTDRKNFSTECTQSDNADGCKGCKCSCYKWKRLPPCHVHQKKRCRVCNELSPFYCKMPPLRYPEFYFY